MMNLLYFSIEGIRCALPIDDIRSVSRMVKLEGGADSSRHIAGTIKYHGDVIPVYSMRGIFGFKERPPNPSDVLIITCTGKKSVALWADMTLNVREGPDQSPDNEDFPGFYVNSESEIVIHDLESFLCSDDFTELYKILSISSSISSEEINRNRITAAADQIDPEKNREILSRRAFMLAQPAGETDEGAPIDILIFRLMYQEYAIEMEYIVEVLIHGEITPVPGTPDYIAGICAVRGEIISLVDLRVLFDLPDKGLTDLNRVIVLKNDDIKFGILADYITDIGTIIADQISPSHKSKTPRMDKYLKGMVRDSIIMLDAEKIMSDPAMVVYDT